jgi:hypothetical protein
MQKPDIRRESIDMPLLEATESSSSVTAAESSSSVTAAAESSSSVTAAESSSSVTTAAESSTSVTAATAESSSSVTAAATDKVGNGVASDSDGQQALDSAAEGDRTEKEGEEKREEKGESLKDVNNDLEMSSDDDEDSREGFDPHDTCGDGADRQVTVQLNLLFKGQQCLLFGIVGLKNNSLKGQRDIPIN